MKKVNYYTCNNTGYFFNPFDQRYKYDCKKEKKKSEKRISVKPKKVTRVEVVDENGRSYVNNRVGGVELSLQDDGKSLKIFIKSKS